MYRAFISFTSSDFGSIFHLYLLHNKCFIHNYNNNSWNTNDSNYSSRYGYSNYQRNISWNKNVINFILRNWKTTCSRLMDSHHDLFFWMCKHILSCELFSISLFSRSTSSGSFAAFHTCIELSSKRNVHQVVCLCVLFVNFTEWWCAIYSRIWYISPPDIIYNLLLYFSVVTEFSKSEND